MCNKRKCITDYVLIRSLHNHGFTGYTMCDLKMDYVTKTRKNENKVVFRRSSKVKTPIARKKSKDKVE